MKAHRSDEELAQLQGDAYRFGQANKVVDHHAKLALSGHPSADPELLDSIDLAATRAQAFVKVASAVLPLFRNEMRWRRAPPSERRSRLKQNWHMWRQTELGMQCAHCLTVCDSSDRPADGCRGTPPAIAALLSDPKGHSLVAVSGAALASVSGSSSGPVGVPAAGALQ